MKDWQQKNQVDCGNKKSFPSFRLASDFNNRQHRRGSVLLAKGKKIEKMHVYKCKNCNEFHIGHATRNRQRLLRPQSRHAPPLEEYQIEE
jgi:hypothetical protein